MIAIKAQLSQLMAESERPERRRQRSCQLVAVKIQNLQHGKLPKRFWHRSRQMIAVKTEHPQRGELPQRCRQLPLQMLVVQINLHHSSRRRNPGGANRHPPPLAHVRSSPHPTQLRAAVAPKAEDTSVVIVHRCDVRRRLNLLVRPCVLPRRHVNKSCRVECVPTDGAGVATNVEDLRTVRARHHVTASEAHRARRIHAHHALPSHRLHLRGFGAPARVSFGSLSFEVQVLERIRECSSCGWVHRTFDAPALLLHLFVGQPPPGCGTVKL
mmetsp:Transcript_35693/g.89155  ORF Transcript_35693/g.89155 Transcript_35693/m.89155 type:complete len:270 (+) Transcript_35693:588-1397(+)